MSAIASTRIDTDPKNGPTSGRLFFLDLGAGRILSANARRGWRSELAQFHYVEQQVTAWEGGAGQLLDVLVY